MTIPGENWVTLDIEALVDIGATYTTVPAPLLERLGVVPHVRDTFILADGRRADRDIGRTWVRVDGRGELTLVVFGEPDAPTLLGADTLEGLRLAAYPVGRPLIPVPGLLLGSWSFLSPLTLGQLGLQPAIISEHRL